MYERLPEPAKEHAKMLARCKTAEGAVNALRTIVRSTQDQLADLGLKRQHELSQNNPYAKAFWAMQEVMDTHDKKGRMPWWNNL